jgi:hypothetical protein
LIQTVQLECSAAPTPPKTNRERLIEISENYFNIDPTPNDEQPDDYACVHSLTTIIKKLYPDFPVMTYTPTFLTFLRGDKRFKETFELKEGNIIVSPTLSGNGTIVGHTGIIGKAGKIYSNATSSGMWMDKYDAVSWIDRYSRKGGLSLHIFEVL